MGWITSQQVDGWYKTLHKSPLNPPDWAFGAAWTALYLALSIAFWLVWKAPESKQRTTALRFFIFHMLLNWSWTPLFFTAHALLPSFLLILALIVTAAMLARFNYVVSKTAALAFIPYLGWLGFAGHLAYYVWQQNG